MKRTKDALLVEEVHALRCAVGRSQAPARGVNKDTQKHTHTHTLLHTRTHLSAPDSAGLKAYTTAATQHALSVCRESCGGHGYAAVNRLGQLRSDHDIFQTFEGDNTVLLQQVCRYACVCMFLLHPPRHFSCPHMRPDSPLCTSPMHPHRAFLETHCGLGHWHAAQGLPCTFQGRPAEQHSELSQAIPGWRFAAQSACNARDVCCAST